MLLLANAQPNPLDIIKQRAMANIFKGDIMYALKNYNEAYEYFYQGKVEAEKSKDPCYVGEYSYRLGMVMYQRQKFKDAANYFLQCFNQSEGCSQDFVRFYRRQEVINNAALSFLDNKQPDSALKYYNKGINYLDANANNFPGKEVHLATAKAVMQGTAAQAYLQKHDARGEALFKENIATDIRLNCEPYNAIEMQLKLAAFYMDSSFTQRLPQALATLQQVRAGLDTLDSKTFETEYNLLMSRYSNDVHQPALAYNYLSKYTVLRNVLREETIKRNEIDVKEQMHIMQDRYEMEMMTKDNALNKLYIYISWVLTGVASITIYQVLKNWKKSKTLVTSLIVLNEKLNIKSDKVEKAIAELGKKGEEKDYIMRVVAHDLRNPVAAIATLSRVIKEEYENEPDNREYLDLIQNACKESLELISNILQLDQQNKHSSLRRQIFNANDSIFDSIQLLRLKAAEKKIDLVAMLEDTPKLINADPEKLKHILNNLIVNAIKFSHADSCINVGVRQNKSNHDILISVTDQGIGIPDSMKDLVFNVFTEAKRKGTNKESTFGLGLSICKQFVEAHGGKIWFDSKENNGTTFYVQLPGEPLPEEVESYEEAFA